ncbi:hypothetical protein OKW34_005715 [Paraburkholderia youngii]|uniref:Uncharacterized protein n=1 Tax=Paraburkholderia youngii TaxID=2782701 RepID=A0A7W8P1W9_9BURK|nr:hypothetical protein [Paraburkholderia youngii]
MEKWLVILGIWMMCAACAVFFIRGATRSSNPREDERKQASAASRGSAGDTRNALND